MVSNIRFSVIIPIYNTVDYISKCIDSVINQSYAAYEIILVNDGSTDGSDRVCEEYKDKYKDKRAIKVINKKNGGASSARNAGIKEATGDYLFFLDSDDYIKTDTLESFALLIEKYGLVDFVHGRMSYFKDGSDFLCEWPYFFDNTWIEKPCAGQKAFCLLLKNQRVIQMGIRGVYKRSFVVENDLFLDEGDVTDDEDWTVRLFFLSSSVIGNNNPNYCYREGRKGSIMNSSTLNLCIGKYNAYKKWNKVLNDEACSELFAKYLIRERGRRFDNCIKLLARSLNRDQLDSFLKIIDENFHVNFRGPDSVKDFIFLVVYRILGLDKTAKLFNFLYSCCR